MIKRYLIILFLCFVFSFSFQANAALYSSKTAAGIPECSDDRVLHLLIDKIKEFQKEKMGSSIKEKRAGTLLINDLKGFKEISSENFSREDDFVTASVLVTMKINQGITDDNMRLCKSISTGPSDNLYLIIYRYSYQTNIMLLNYPSHEEIIINYD